MGARTYVDGNGELVFNGYRVSSLQDEKNWDFPSGPLIKNLLSSAEDLGLILGWGTKIPHAIGCVPHLDQSPPTAMMRSHVLQMRLCSQKLNTEKQKMKRGMERNCGDVCTALWLYLIPLSWTLTSGKFKFCILYHRKKWTSKLNALSNSMKANSPL